MVREPKWEAKAELADSICILFFFLTRTNVIENCITLLSSIKVIIFSSTVLFLVLDMHVQVLWHEPLLVIGCLAACGSMTYVVGVLRYLSSCQGRGL